MGEILPHGPASSAEVLSLVDDSLEEKKCADHR